MFVGGDLCSDSDNYFTDRKLFQSDMFLIFSVAITDVLNNMEPLLVLCLLTIFLSHPVLFY